MIKPVFQPVKCLDLLRGFNLVLRHIAHHFAPGHLARGKGAGLPGAAGGVVLGLKIHHNLPAKIIGQADGVAVLVAQGKFRRFHTNFQPKSFSLLL